MENVKFKFLILRGRIVFQETIWGLFAITEDLVKNTATQHKSLLSNLTFNHFLFFFEFFADFEFFSFSPWISRSFCTAPVHSRFVRLRKNTWFSKFSRVQYRSYTITWFPQIYTYFVSQNALVQSFHECSIDPIDLVQITSSNCTIYAVLEKTLRIFMKHNII